MAVRQCPHCGKPYNRVELKCPHCGRPSEFPNVDDAKDDDERRALDVRYKDACMDADARGADEERRKFEAAVAGSRAVRAVKVSEMLRLASSDSQVARTYYQEVEGGSRVPDDNVWDRLRRLADVVAFSGYYRSIHFAALVIDDSWPANYGEAALFFNEDMIAHRTTLFEDNLVLWQAERGKLVELPKGYRAVWNDRHLLAVAKVGSKLTASGNDFATLLLANGISTGSDSFIEAHLLGPFTVSSLSRTLVKRGYFGPLQLADLADRAKEFGFEFREVP